MPDSRLRPRPRRADPGPPREPTDDRLPAEVQALLESVPAPLEPLDADTLDGFLCGVIVQPRLVPPERWMPHVTDSDGRALPSGFDAVRLRALVLRRHAELTDAIARRQWFDPWLFAGDGEADGGSDAVYPWVAGFAAALDLFPELVRRGDDDALLEPLALLYRHLDAGDLEDADELIALIEASEPPAGLTEAVE
ncbi:MAG: YecA family protein, partial [Caldimonas sp.]